MAINSPPSAAPSTAPTFTTTNYTAGSPHWFIQFAGGDSLFGYPANAGLGTSNWQVIPASSGVCQGATHTPTDDTYTSVLAFIQNAGCGGNVTGAGIIANGDQAAGTSDTITDVLYDGETLVSGPDVVTVTNPGAQTGTVGTAISTLDIAASSNKGDQIASYGANGLPPGLSVDATTGAITGTPTTAGTYSVTITATDNGGTQGTASFTWTIGRNTCHVINLATWAQHSSLPTAVTNASPGATLLVVGTCAATSIPAADHLTIIGLGRATVDGGGNGSALTIGAGAVVSISTLTITDGRSSTYGGGIFNDGGTVTLGNVAVTGNTAAEGGGIYNDGGTVTLSGLASVSHNTATEDGGGIFNGAESTVTLSGLATVSFNAAGTDGGGIWNGGTLTGAVAGHNVFGNQPDNIAT
jgi:hypothetical protein